MEQDALLPAELADLRHWLDGADLVVGVHDGHQGSVRADGRLQILQVDDAVFIYRQQRHLEALLLQGRQGVEHRVVLDGRGDQVLFPLLGPGIGGKAQGPVVPPRCRSR